MSVTPGTERPSRDASRLTEHGEAAIPAHHAGGTVSHALHGTGWPRWAAGGVVELPPEFVVLFPGYERRTVQGALSEDAGTHARRPGRLHLGQPRGLTAAVEAGEVNSAPRRPGRS